MTNKPANLYRLPAALLLGLGLLDLVRGLMHTFLLPYAAQTFAGFDLATTPADQMFLLGVFGISNWLTGAIYILISRKTPQLAAHILTIIPAAYIVGLIGIRVSGIQAAARFDGKYMMLVYLLVSAAVGVFSLIRQRKAAA